jgi:hypothetical protein
MLQRPRKFAADMMGPQSIRTSAGFSLSAQEGRRLLCAAAVLVVAHLPVLTANFAIHNDYSLWTSDRSSFITWFPETWHLLAIGRPLGAFLLNLHFSCLESLPDFLVSRWFALGVTLAAGGLLAEHFSRRLHLPAGTAVCAAACVFLLPASQLFVSWVTNFVPGTLTVLLSLLVYRLLDSGVEPLSLRLQLADWRRFLTAQALFFCLLCIYPPSALFFLVPAFANLLFTPLDSWPRTRGRLIRDLAFTAGAMLEYFVLVRLVYLPLAKRLWPEIRATVERIHGTQYEFAVTSSARQLLDNLKDVLEVSLAGPLHAVVHERTAALSAMVIAAAFLIVAAWRFRKMQEMQAPRSTARATQRWWAGEALWGRWAGEALLAGLALFFLSAAPVVLARPDGRGNGYRLMFAANAIGSLLAFWILPRSAGEYRSANFKRFAAALPLCVVMISAFLAHCNLQHVAANAVIELDFFRHALADVDPRTTRCLRVIRPIDHSVFVEQPLQKDFRLGTMNYSAVRGIVDEVFEERGLKVGSLALDFPASDSVSSPARRPLEIGTRVIDVNDAVRWTWKCPELLVESVNGFNVVGFGNRVFAIPQGEGAFEQQRVDRCSYSAVYIGKSVQEVIQAVKTARR